MERWSTKQQETRRKGGRRRSRLRTEGVTRRRTDAVGMFSQRRGDHLYPLPSYPPAIGVICLFSRFSRKYSEKSVGIFFPRDGTTRAGQFGGKRDRIAVVKVGRRDNRIFFRAREHGATPPCELVSLLILISYRNPFPYISATRRGASR